MRKHSPVFPKLLWGGYIPCRRVEYRGEWWSDDLRYELEKLRSGRLLTEAMMGETWLVDPVLIDKLSEKELYELLKKNLYSLATWEAQPLKDLAKRKMMFRDLLAFRREWFLPLAKNLADMEEVANCFLAKRCDGHVFLTHRETFTVRAKDGLPHLLYEFSPQIGTECVCSSEIDDFASEDDGEIRIRYECPLWNGLLPEGINYRETWKVEIFATIIYEPDGYYVKDEPILDYMDEIQASVEIVKGDERIVETLEGPLRLARRTDSSPLLEMAKLPEERRRLRLMLTYLLLSSAPLRYAIQKAKAR